MHYEGGINKIKIFVLQYICRTKHQLWSELVLFLVSVLSPCSPMNIRAVCIFLYFFVCRSVNRSFLSMISLSTSLFFPLFILRLFKVFVSLSLFLFLFPLSSLYNQLSLHRFIIINIVQLFRLFILQPTAISLMEKAGDTSEVGKSEED